MSPEEWIECSRPVRVGPMEPMSDAGKALAREVGVLACDRPGCPHEPLFTTRLRAPDSTVLSKDCLWLCQSCADEISLDVAGYHARLMATLAANGGWPPGYRQTSS